MKLTDLFGGEASQSSVEQLNNAKRVKELEKIEAGQDAEILELERQIAEAM